MRNPREGRYDIVLENVHLAYRNFSGKSGEFNAEGQRNFCIIFDRDDLIETAEKLLLDGVNIKRLHPTDPEDTRQPYAQVAVKYRNRKGEALRPPKIVLVSSRGKTEITEDDVNIVDWAEIDHADLVLTVGYYNVNKKEGWKLYLKKLYATIHEDEFEKKYYDGPDYATGITDDDDDEIPFK